MGLEAVEVPETPTKTSTPTALAPGFRFHPTDEELVIYYLKRKVFGKPFRFNAISEVDIYKSEPWDLAGKSSLKSRDQEYYFFSALDKKYGNGARMNRATNQGYWKATGNDRPVKHDSRIVGMKKTLVFHSGRAPDGKRTNWVMHEYRLIEAELETAGGVGGIQDAFVLCRVFHKSNIGPPSGQRYAPFIEEDWDDGKLTVVPGMESVDEPIAGRGQDACIEGNNNHLRCIEGNAHGPNVEGNAHDPNVAGKNTDQDTHSINKAPLSALGLPRDNQLVLSMCKIERMDDHALPCVVNTEERLDDHPSPRLDDHPSRRLDDHPSPGVDDEQHLPCMENRLTLPLLKYKRRRQNEFNSEYSNASENSSRTTQDRCSSTTTTAATTTTMPIRTIPTTKNFLSALVEYSLLESFEPKDSAPVPPPDLDAANLNSSVPPSYLKFIQDLQNEIHKISLERETLKFEMTSAQAMINILQSRIDLLNKENEDLKRNIRDRK